MLGCVRHELLCQLHLSLALLIIYYILYLYLYYICSFGGSVTGNVVTLLPLWCVMTC